MIPFSAGSTASASPGSPSVTRLIHKICMGRSGIGSPRKGGRNIVHISPELLVMVYLMNLRILSNILLPSFTAFTMVEKLSSRSIMCEDSFATSVPVMPIATPMSALLSAGASFTPSPVIATNSPLSCRAFTIFIFCAGATLA
ncbi:hypothetical protein BMS3Abin09_00648 [bacterium BMS3Abin09]|nr:hypothetical protein BMS3Abin09_00648 [bacterium BMS3Abin09]